MKKVYMSAVAVSLMSLTSATAFAHGGPHFSPADAVEVYTGFGEINGTACPATATITVGPDVHGAGPHLGHADTAKAVFSNSAPCEAYSVEAEFNISSLNAAAGSATGDVTSVVVKYLGTPVCSSTGTYPNALEFVLGAGNDITDAFLPANITVGGCNLGVFASGTGITATN